MPMPKPLDVAVKHLLELKVLEVKKGKYVYSTEFEKSATELKAHPPGFFDGARLAKEVDANCAPVLLAYAQYFKNQRDIKTLATGYVLLIKHLKRLDIKTELTMPVIYAVFYFNDHELLVDEQ